MERFRRLLILWSILLAPWGGPCERMTRAADPISAPVGLLGRAPEARVQRSGDSPGGGSGLPGTYGDLLAEDQEDEESQDDGVVGLLPPFASPSSSTASPT